MADNHQLGVVAPDLPVDAVPREVAVPRAARARLSKRTQMELRPSDLVTLGSDMSQLTPMLEQAPTRCRRNPEGWIVDGG